MRKRIILTNLLICLMAAPPPSFAQEVEEQPKMWFQDLQEYLEDFDEKALWNVKGDSETYRITIDAGIVFRKAVIRLDRKSNRSWVLTTKYKFKDRWESWTRHLTTVQVQEVVTRLNSPEFWAIPTNAEFVDPNEKEGELTSVCIDGTYWVIEAKIKNRYHGSGLHMCGADDVFVPAGLALVKLAGRDIGPIR